MTRAEQLVDVIAEALGVDTGTCSEARFRQAVEAAATFLASTEQTRVEGVVDSAHYASFPEDDGYYEEFTEEGDWARDEQEFYEMLDELDFGGECHEWDNSRIC